MIQSTLEGFVLFIVQIVYLSLLVFGFGEWQELQFDACTVLPTPHYTHVETRSRYTAVTLKSRPN